MRVENGKENQVRWVREFQQRKIFLFSFSKKLFYTMI